jgi:hypothetical protein
MHFAKRTSCVLEFGKLHIRFTSILDKFPETSNSNEIRKTVPSVKKLLLIRSAGCLATTWAISCPNTAARPSSS